MNCETAFDLMVDALADEIDPQARTALDEHLQTCASCAQHSQELGSLWDDLGRIPAPPPQSAASVRFGRRLAERRRSRWTVPLRAAAAVVLLVAGGVVGRMLPLQGGSPESGAGVEGSAFILLIRGTRPDEMVPQAQLFEEYGAWAGTLRQEGVLIAAEKLGEEEGVWFTGGLGSEPIPESRVTGFFLVRAASYDEALQIALESPHIAYGGTIEVRAIDP